MTAAPYLERISDIAHIPGSIFFEWYGGGGMEKFSRFSFPAELQNKITIFTNAGVSYYVGWDLSARKKFQISRKKVFARKKTYEERKYEDLTKEK